MNNTTLQESPEILASKLAQVAAELNSEVFEGCPEIFGIGEESPSFIHTAFCEAVGNYSEWIKTGVMLPSLEFGVTITKDENMRLLSFVCPQAYEYLMSLGLIKEWSGPYVDNQPFNLHCVNEEDYPDDMTYVLEMDADVVLAFYEGQKMFFKLRNEFMGQ